MTRLFYILYILGPIPFFLVACGTAPTPSATGPAAEPAAAGATPSTSADCPAPTDPCMNEDNHAACLAVAEKCPGKVVRLESCPLQFACND